MNERNLDWDLTRLDTNSGDLRLIEGKELAKAREKILLTPNECRV